MAPNRFSVQCPLRFLDIGRGRRILFSTPRVTLFNFDLAVTGGYLTASPPLNAILIPILNQETVERNLPLLYKTEYWGRQRKVPSLSELNAGGGGESSPTAIKN